LRGGVVREAGGDADDLGAERSELQLDGVVGDAARGVEDAEGGGDGDDVGNGPAAERIGTPSGL
jgi:hypothetical protein